MLLGEEVAVPVHGSDEGIRVTVPALPGCWSEGDTKRRR
jgi:hypothetical protein